MLFTTVSLVLVASTLTEALRLGPPGRMPAGDIKEDWDKFLQVGRGRKGRGGRRPPFAAPVAEPTSDCAISYSDATSTVLVTKEVQVWKTTSVYEEATTVTTVITEGDEVTTSYITSTATVSSTFTTTTTVDSPGEDTPPAYTDGPSPPASSDGPSPPASSDAPTSPSSTNGPAPPESSEVPDGSDDTSVPPSGTAGPTESTDASTSSSSATSSTSSSAAPTGACPAVWRQITQEMMGAFAGCNRPARSSIRFAFHDAAGYSSKTTPYGPASGGADGSILYSDEEVNRAGNQPLPFVANIFRGVYANFEDQVTAADFVQFAGSIGVRMCGGPIYKTVVGREDDQTPCPEYMMPAAFGANASYEALTSLWADKGIDERELAALLGAHSVSVAFSQVAQGIPPNSPQDSTPAAMDMVYYKETQANVAPNGVFRFDSDVNLSNATTVVGQAFTEFSDEGGFDVWQKEYAAAAYKLSIMGLGPEKEAELIDCTDVIEELTS